MRQNHDTTPIHTIQTQTRVALQEGEEKKNDLLANRMKIFHQKEQIQKKNQEYSFPLT